MPTIRSILLLSLFTTGCKKTDPTEPPVTEVPTPTEVIDTCGDGTVDEGEQCDDGDDNAADANCLLDCSAAETQNVTVTGTELEAADVDAQAVTFADAPAGDGAWTPADSDLNGDGLAKFEINIPLYDFTGDLTPTQFQALEQSPYQPPTTWLTEVLLSEIAEISFWTNTPVAESASPYFLVLYTQRDGVDDTDWYGYRLTAVPTSARFVDAPADTWVKWTVSGTENLLTFADQPTIGTFNGSTLPVLTSLQEGTYDWSVADSTYPVTDIDYGAEKMRFVSIQTGSGNDTTGSDAALDLIEIELTDGRRVLIDLEP